MLYFAKCLRELNFGQLMDVYAQSNRENGDALYPQLSSGERVLRAEQDFYQYLRECFFPTPGAMYALWVENGRYVSALRLEPYQDGLLLEALETAPDHRQKGYATKLVGEATAAVGQTVYAHVSRKNTASQKPHIRCGFHRILSYARYADGSVLTDSDTYCKPSR